MADFWKTLCRPHGNISAWNGQDLGFCFEELVVVFPPHVILLAITVYHLSSTRGTGISSYVYPFPVFLKLRLLCTIGLMLTAFAAPLLTKIMLEFSLSAIDIVTSGAVCICWFIHSFYIWKLKYLILGTYRGPLLNILSYILTFISACFMLHTAILLWIHRSEYFNPYLCVCLFVNFGLHCVYIISLLPNTQQGINVQLLSHSLNINESEEESLFNSSRTTYGAIRHDLSPLEGEDNKSWLSRLTFHWVNPLMVKGAQHDISTANDLFALPRRLNTNSIENKFGLTLELISNSAVSEKCKSNSQRKSMDESCRIPDVKIKTKNYRRTLLKALNSAFGWEYYSLGILKLFADLAGFAGPLLLNFLVSYVENKNEPEVHGVYYAIGLLVSTLIGSLCSTQFDYNMQVVGLKIRCSVITTVYKKALRISSVSSSKFSTGEIVNFMSTDTDRVVNFCPSFHAFWSLPFQVGVSLYLLHSQVGLAFLAGLGFAILLIPINKWLANKIGQLSTEMMLQKDARVKLMTEILRGIRVVKYYAWEDTFQTKIEKLRSAELKSLKGRKYLDAMCVYFWATTPVLISILTFTTYTLLGNTLTAAKVFTSLSLFLMLISPLNAFPWVLNGLMEAWVSLKRLQSFVSLKNIDLEEYYSQIHDAPYDEEELVITTGTFSWQEEADKQNSVKSVENHFEDDRDHHGAMLLNDINLTVEKGQFVGVIGKVGSGKSSLLSAILAEMHRVGGQIWISNLEDGFALASQEAWIQQCTIRDNILFGRQYDHRKYEKVLDAAALTEDLKVFSAGDKTMVGENGVTLSGGQKARVALARALYQDKGVYLLDDPLAAVDAYVAQQLYDKCIMGMLRKKTRILCTHHVKFLSSADVVVVMEDGKISRIGSPSEVLDHDFLKENKMEDHKMEEDVETDEVENGEVESEQVEEEGMERGVVRLSVYRAYWSAVGVCLAPSILTALFLMQASRNVNDWWLSYWVTNSRDSASTNHSSSNDTGNSTSDDIQFYLTVYGALAGANSLFTLLRAFLFAYGGICAAQFLHKRLLSVMLKAPVSFFDTNPIGRIINRFSSDLYTIDDSLPFILNIFLAQLYGILGTVVVICYGLPWFTLLLLPLGIVYYKIQHFYRHTSREVKRITSVSLSPVYAHFSETVTGLTTIRAFRESERFRKENIEKLDLNLRAQFSGQAVASWLGFRLQMMGVVMVTGIAFISVLQHHFQAVNAGLVGLALSYALSVTNLLSGVVSSFTETEKQLVSVERAQQYLNIPSENLQGSLLVSPSWPTMGVVHFKNVFLRYRNDLSDALRGVTFCTQPSEKVGIVGRTGSGKSSLFQALFRIVEIRQGDIKVDNMSIKFLDLKEIRSRFAVIPQDPFLFSGTVRENLDPSNVYGDEEIWNSLSRCHLVSAVEILGGLGAEVGERGKMFSVGQKQLLCLARAILTKTKMLCIDEATASVDMKTDSLIQVTIREEFKDSTVLTIAHRIDTVMDSDRVLVMRDGKVAEFDTPSVLMRNPNSLFSKLVSGNS
ncbi:ATP-binding cassette sub-family C member 10-like [Saccostrea echinata]|uniref:ATP-binding cassette sub-family C member 10-like n=1 Tax=Saccostrea echinata TaxID=191078 RepID=UPI002A812738|nr:ATP-binding cassette sub-family C member 10-like [Saccostrea echinata]